MAKTSFLKLVNKVLQRINKADISDVSTVTGHSQIVVDHYNEAAMELAQETDWYELYSTRTFKTLVYTASTIAFVDSDPDTITDSANGFGSFNSGTEVVVSGSSNNDGVYEVITSAAGTLTLDSTEELTAEAASASISITPISYPVASDHGRTIDIVDITNNRLVYEEGIKISDSYDPDMSTTSTTLSVTQQGSTFRFVPTPGGIYTMRERYWKLPSIMIANSDTTDLPIELENLLIQWSLLKTLEYMNKFDSADRVRAEFNRMLKRARKNNKRKIDRLFTMGGTGRHTHGLAIHPPVFPSNYGRRGF